jgi:probable rRNA maturation factor
MSASPELVWTNRQRTVPARSLQLPLVEEVVRRAWPDIMAAVRRPSVLAACPEILFVLVSDERIAALHDEFMKDPTPTDVITFRHGEIVMSAETARREARRRKLPLPQEISRYAVHGLLHLAGWSDTGTKAAAAMIAMQEKILRRATRGLC